MYSDKHTHSLSYLFQAEKKHKSFQELDRFMHYYTRYKNHEHSYRVTHPRSERQLPEPPRIHAVRSVATHACSR